MEKTRADLWYLSQSLRLFSQNFKFKIRSAGITCVGGGIFRIRARVTGPQYRQDSKLWEPSDGSQVVKRDETKWDVMRPDDYSHSLSATILSNIHLVCKFACQTLKRGDNYRKMASHSIECSVWCHCQVSKYWVASITNLFTSKQTLYWNQIVIFVSQKNAGTMRI